MSRYIDIDKVIWNAVMVEGVAIPIYLKDKVDNAPTEDVAPVVHAHWEWFADWKYCTGQCIDRYCENAGHRCSKCGYEPKENDEVDIYNGMHNPPDYKHCPGCGATMDEEVTEE